MTLLPKNTTELERKLSEILRQSVEMDASRITGIKFLLLDGWLDALIYEYGLSELSPYFDDKRTLISQGIAWSRIRGTPQSLLTALQWVNISASITEWQAKEDHNSLQKTDYQPHLHFAEYDLQLASLPNNTDICNIAKMAVLAQPIRSRLWRIVFGFDRDVFCLDDSQLNDAWLDDDSGVRPTREQLPCLPNIEQMDVLPKLSFKTRHGALATRDDTDAYGFAHVFVSWHIKSWQAHMPILDDEPDAVEAWSMSTNNATAISPAIYNGQIWADQAWQTDKTWANANILVATNIN